MYICKYNIHIYEKVLIKNRKKAANNKQKSTFPFYALAVSSSSSSSSSYVRLSWLNGVHSVWRVKLSFTIGYMYVYWLANALTARIQVNAKTNRKQQKGNTRFRAK